MMRRSCSGGVVVAAAALLLLLLLLGTTTGATAFQSPAAAARHHRDGTPPLERRGGSVADRQTGARSVAVVVAAAGAGGGGDKERMARLMRIKKIKESGGDYEALLNEDKAASSARGGPAVLPSEVDYMELLNKEDGGGTLSGEDYDEEDRALYAELRRQEKQALVDKILKAKNSASGQQQAKGKGAPSPYIQRKLDQAAEGEGSVRRSDDPNERFKDVETYNPQSVSWGLYPRPKNIPEAFGGKPIPEGGVRLDDDKEWLAKYEEMMTKVNAYKREIEGMELTPLEKEDESRIQAARQQARQFMLKGEYEAAVNVLAPWRPKCSIKSSFGCATLMDLAVAYEAIYEFDKAQEIYKLVRASPIKDLRVKAKALNLGAEAMKRLGIGSKSNVNPRNMVNFAYIPAQLEGSYGLYMKARGGPDLDDAPRETVVGSVSQALEILEDSVIAQGVGVRFQDVVAALRAIHLETVSADDQAKTGAGPARYMQRIAASDLEGRWRCRLTCHQEAVDFLTKVDVWQRIESTSSSGDDDGATDGKVTGYLPINPFEVLRDVKTAFRWEAGKRVLRYGDPDAFFGLPSGLPHTLRVLHLGPTMMVTARCTDSKGSTPREAYEARFAVWTRAK